MKTKKRLLFMVMAFTLLLSMPLEVSAIRNPERNIKIWINDFYIMSDVHPFIENSRTYVPIRFIAEELGYDVEWDGGTRTVSISQHEQSIQFVVDSDVVCINNETQYTIDAPARLKDQRTFIPIRTIVELFGEEVEYDDAHKVAIIGNNFDPDEFYPLKYYFKDNDPFITNSKVNFVTYIIAYSDGRRVNLNSDTEIFELIDKEGKVYKPIDFESEVEKDKQLLDKHYVAPIDKDPFVGSWYGITKVSGTTDYYDQYVYIEKINENEYLYTKRSIKANGSELITKSYAKYDENEGIIKKEASFETTKATGDFNFSWYSTSGNFEVQNFDYMEDSKDPKIFLRKY